MFCNEKYKKQKDVKITEKYLQLHGQWTRIVSEELLKDNLKTVTNMTNHKIDNWFFSPRAILGLWLFIYIHRKEEVFCECQ